MYQCPALHCKLGRIKACSGSLTGLYLATEGNSPQTRHWSFHQKEALCKAERARQRRLRYCQRRNRATVSLDIIPPVSFTSGNPR